VWVAGKSAASVRLFLTEAIKLICAQASFKEGARVWARRSVSLDENLVSAGWVVGSLEEVVETYFVQ
jgi:hypothetical protein